MQVAAMFIVNNWDQFLRMLGVGSKQSLHKISSEKNLCECVHNDVMMECAMLKDVYNDLDRSSKVPDFTQMLSFSRLLYISIIDKNFKSKNQTRKPCCSY